VATASCGDCGKPVCGPCTTFEGGRDRCPACVARYWRNKKRRAVAFTVVGVLALVGAGLWLALRGVPGAGGEATLPAHEFNYGPDNALVFGLRQHLKKEPCDRTKALELVQLMFNAQDWRGTIVTSDAFLARCGKYPPLRQLTYTAHTRLSEFELAARDATELLEGAPTNVGYWLWRGMALEADQKPAQALADFKQAFLLQPGQGHVANHLASAYERQHKPCEAMVTLLEHLQANPEGAGSRALLERIAMLEAVGSCDVGGKGQAVVNATKGMMWVEPLFNGKHRGRFLVDTGASVVTISQEFAVKLGLDLTEAATARVLTANGPITTQVALAQSIELQGARARGVTVHVSSTLPAHMDGLLGLSFLARFEVKLDAKAGRLELSEHKPR
jgi:aspartyl protease family protein